MLENPIDLLFSMGGGVWTPFPRPPLDLHMGGGGGGGGAESCSYYQIKGNESGMLSCQSRLLLCALFCFSSNLAYMYIANMDPDQTAPEGAV